MSIYTITENIQKLSRVTWQNLLEPVNYLLERKCNRLKFGACVSFTSEWKIENAMIVSSIKKLYEKQREQRLRHNNTFCISAIFWVSSPNVKKT